MSDRTSVLVVGGGPVGLSMALFAARAGLEPLLVERRRTTSALPRATHVSRRTMELFRGAGLEPQIRAAGLEVIAHDDPRGPAISSATLSRIVVSVPTLAAMDQAEVLETGEAEMSVPGPCRPFWCGQDRMEPMLARQAAAAGARLRFGHELVDLSLGPAGALAQVRGPDGCYSVAARYLVAADGSRSETARRVGIGRHGLGTVGWRVTVIFRADLDRVMGGRRFFMSMVKGPRFSGAVMALNDPGRWAAALPFDPDHGDSADDFTPARCQELIREAIGDPSVPVEIEARFTWAADHRTADHFRAGPLFLVGDAAHVHPPSGGYGSNVGYQDAHNLAWKLAAVERGWAGPELLDSYEAERRPVALATAEQSLLLDGHGELLAGVQRADPATLLLGYSYGGSTAVLGPPGVGPLDGPPVPTGRPGTRVPHLSGVLPSGAPSSTVDLCQDVFTLLTTDPGWRPAAGAVCAELRVPVRTVVAGRGAGADLRTDLPAAEVRAACGIAATGAVLVRPDGIVGWRTRGRPHTVPVDIAAEPGDPADPAARCLGRALSALLSRPATSRPAGSVPPTRKEAVPS